MEYGDLTNVPILFSFNILKNTAYSRNEGRFFTCLKRDKTVQSTCILQKRWALPVETEPRFGRIFLIIQCFNVETIDKVRIVPIIPEVADRGLRKPGFERNLKPACVFYRRSNYGQVGIRANLFVTAYL